MVAEPAPRGEWVQRQPARERARCKFIGCRRANTAAGCVCVDVAQSFCSAGQNLAPAVRDPKWVFSERNFLCPKPHAVAGNPGTPNYVFLGTATTMIAPDSNAAVRLEGGDMAEATPSPETIRRFNDLVRGIKFAMLTTEDVDGFLRSRPLATQQADAEGNWFFTGLSTSKVQEIRQHRQVNVSYVNPERQRYVSVNGTGELVRDRDRMKALWNPLYKAYFPKGPDDPDLALVKVHVNEVEFWDSSSSRMVRMVGWVKGSGNGRS